MFKWLLLHLIPWWKAPPSATIECDNPLGEEPAGQVDDAAYERQLLAHLLDATKTMLP